MKMLERFFGVALITALGILYYIVFKQFPEYTAAWLLGCAILCSFYDMDEDGLNWFDTLILKLFIWLTAPAWIWMAL
jgi:hypothetical protein